MPVLRITRSPQDGEFLRRGLYDDQPFHNGTVMDPSVRLQTPLLREEVPGLGPLDWLLEAPNSLPREYRPENPANDQPEQFYNYGAQAIPPAWDRRDGERDPFGYNYGTKHDIATRLADEMIGARRIEPSTALAKAVSDAVDAVYGPGYSIQARSGGVRSGQPGSSSGRHVANKQGDKTATDWKIFDPNGKQLAGSVLKPFAQHWVANYGSIGVNAKPGERGQNFTHLDLVRRPSATQRVWFYGDPGFKREEVTAHVGKGKLYAAWDDPKTAMGKAAVQVAEAPKPATAPQMLAGLDKNAHALLSAGAGGPLAPAAVAANEMAQGVPITPASLQTEEVDDLSLGRVNAPRGNVQVLEPVDLPPNAPARADGIVRAAMANDPAALDKAFKTTITQVMMDPTGRARGAVADYLASVATVAPGAARSVFENYTANPALREAVPSTVRGPVDAAFSKAPPPRATAEMPIPQARPSPSSPLVAMPGGMPPADDRPPQRMQQATGPLTPAQPARFDDGGIGSDIARSRQNNAAVYNGVLGALTAERQHPAIADDRQEPVMPMKGSSSMGAGNSMPSVSAAPRLVEQSREPRPFGPVADQYPSREPRQFGPVAAQYPSREPRAFGPVADTEYRVPDVGRRVDEWSAAPRSPDTMPQLASARQAPAANDWRAASQVPATPAPQVNEWDKPPVRLQTSWDTVFGGTIKPELGLFPAAAAGRMPLMPGGMPPLDDIPPVKGMPTIGTFNPPPSVYKPADPMPQKAAPPAPRPRPQYTPPAQKAVSPFARIGTGLLTGGPLGALIGGASSWLQNGGLGNLMSDSVLSRDAPLSNVTSHAASWDGRSSGGGSLNSYSTGNNAAGQLVTNDSFGNSWINNPDGTSTMLY